MKSASSTNRVPRVRSASRARTSILTPSMPAASILLVPILLGLSRSAAAQTDWPLLPRNQDRPIGNTFGEYIYAQSVGGAVAPHQHLGVDILGAPKGTAGSPWVVTMKAGRLRLRTDNPYPELFNTVEILGTDGKVYRYVHLAPGSYHDSFPKHYDAWVPAGFPIAEIVPWTDPPCTTEFHHLHYEVLEDASGKVARNPMATGISDPDVVAPQSDGIFFAEDDGPTGSAIRTWRPHKPVAAPGAVLEPCTVVSGKTDIVIRAWDVDDAGSTAPGAKATWVHDLRWRARAEAGPEPAWIETHGFDKVPCAWGGSGNSWTAAYFSSEPPWESSHDYCKDAPHYAVITNVVGTAPDRAGAWDTTGLSGSYTVTVEMGDFAGNRSACNVRVLVENPPANATTELTIRDGPGDGGALPYRGDTWWQSPDIAVAADTIVIGAATPIEVTVWNLGSRTLPAGETYDLWLGRARRTTAVPHPLPPPDEVVEKKTETVASPWEPGTSRTTRFVWTPAAGTLSAGKLSLVAWVDHPKDPVLAASASVAEDDNRAQRDVEARAP